MNEQQFSKRCEELIVESGLVDYLLQECMKLFRSGVIDVSEYENNARLPKLCLYVALGRAKWQYKPLSLEEFEETVKDLETA